MGRGQSGLAGKHAGQEVGWGGSETRGDFRHDWKHENITTKPDKMLHTCPLTPPPPSPDRPAHPHTCSRFSHLRCSCLPRPPPHQHLIPSSVLQIYTVTSPFPLTPRQIGKLALCLISLLSCLHNLFASFNLLPACFCLRLGPLSVTCTIHYHSLFVGMWIYFFLSIHQFIFTCARFMEPHNNKWRLRNWKVHYLTLVNTQFSTVN